MLRKYCLPVVAALSLLFTSCDANDLYLEDEIVGSWSWIYEDANVFEEEVYDFDPAGRWTYRYIYENIYGEYIYEVDAGTYYISYGQLKLRSNFSDDLYSFSTSIRGDRMILRDGEYYCEFLRYR
jgi:hypothetical protein